VSEEGTLTVRGLEERGDLEFSCIAKNEAGDVGEHFVVKAISEFISLALENGFNCL
jgi:hypothetical protein